MMTENDRRILLDECRSVFTKATQHYSINGFAIVFEVFQDEPCFYFAINTTSNGKADPSTGDWDYPAGDFEGSEPSSDWMGIYSKINSYISELEDEEDSRIEETQEFFISAMESLKKEVSPSVQECVFTVNECNDYDEVIEAVFKRINE